MHAYRHEQAGGEEQACMQARAREQPAGGAPRVCEKVGQLGLHLQRQAGDRVDANVGSPQVSYRESISIEAKGESIVERTMAGKNHFAHVVLKVLPKDRTSGFEFANEVSP
ncbi:hypothetical protein EON68_02405, partial [archaeon]